MAGRAALTGQVVQVADLAVDPEFTVTETVTVGKMRTAIGVPLLREGVVVGVLSLARGRVEPFTERQIELVRTFADQAVIAIENTRLITETREALEQQTATAEVLQVINSSPGDLVPVFDAILEKATGLCECAFGILATYDGERFRHAALRGVPAAYAGFMGDEPRIYGPGTGPAQAVGQKRVIYNEDLMATDVYRSGDPNRRAVVDLAGARTSLIVPLLKDNEARGIINVFRQEVRPFTDKQIALLQSFAAQAVIAMENARLLTETREALERQTATAEVLQVINSSPGDLKPVFEAMLEKALRLCSITHGSLQIYDGQQFRAVAVRGLPEPIADRLRQGYSPIPKHPMWPLLSGASFVHIADLTGIDHTEEVRIAVELGSRTVLFIPLRKDHKLLGQIVAVRQEVRPFSDKQIALLQNFAAQAVIAMENARLLTETREALEQQTATSEVLQVINSSPGDLAPVFDAVLDKAFRLCDGTGGSIWIFQNERIRHIASRGFFRPLRSKTSESTANSPTSMSAIR
jgi:GAF domain-containing protein